MLKGFMLFKRGINFVDYGNIHIFEHYLILKTRKLLHPKYNIKIFGETSSAYLLLWWETNLELVSIEIKKIITLIYKGKIEFDTQIYFESLKEVTHEILSRKQDVLVYKKYCELLHGKCLGSPIGDLKIINNLIKTKFITIKEELEAPLYYSFRDNYDVNYMQFDKMAIGPPLNRKSNLEKCKIFDIKDPTLYSKIRIFTPLFSLMKIQKTTQDYKSKLKLRLLTHISELLLTKTLSKYNFTKYYLGSGKILLDGIPYLIADISISAPKKDVIKIFRLLNVQQIQKWMYQSALDDFKESNFFCEDSLYITDIKDVLMDICFFYQSPLFKDIEEYHEVINEIDIGLLEKFFMCKTRNSYLILINLSNN